jgi:hypothetical protein
MFPSRPGRAGGEDSLAIHHFAPRYTGGVELVTLRAARWLLAHRHEVEIVCVERSTRGSIAVSVL